MLDEDPVAAASDPAPVWVDAWRVALALTVAEPLLAVWSFARTPAIDGADDRVVHVVVAITPVAVRAYRRSAEGDIDTAHEIAAWDRAALRVTVARHGRLVTLGLTTPAGERVTLQARHHAEVDRLVRLLEYPVDV